MHIEKMGSKNRTNIKIKLATSKWSSLYIILFVFFKVSSSL